MPSDNLQVKHVNTDKEKEIIIRHLCVLYRQAQLRLDLEEAEAPNRPLSNVRLDDKSYIYKLDRSLLCCSSETQWVIRKEYLEVNPKGWYLDYVSRYTFQRMRKKAVREFYDILDLEAN